MNYVPLQQVIADYIITMDGDDYTSNVSDVAIQNIAMRGIRELGFDVTSRVRSLKRSVESNNTVILPEDFVDIVKLGVVDGDGVIRVFKQNKNLNYSRKNKVTLNERGLPAGGTGNTSEQYNSAPHPIWPIELQTEWTTRVEPALQRQTAVTWTSTSLRTTCIRVDWEDSTDWVVVTAQENTESILIKTELRLPPTLRQRTW